MSYNRLLGKQIKKYLPDELLNQPDLADFLNAVNDSYTAYEKDKALSERAFSISESEYIEINERLNNELQIKSRLMRTLKDTIGILGEENSENIEDIGLLTDQLYRQVMMSSENEQIVDSLISSYLTGIVFEAPDGKIMLVNQTFCDLFSTGKTPEEILNSNTEDISENILRLISEPDRVASDSQKIRAALKSVSGDLLYLVDGRIFERNYVPVFREGELNGHLWSFTDVSVREKSVKAITERENMQRLILNSAMDAVIIIDKDGLITFWNQQAEHIFGWNEQEVLGINLTDTFIPHEFRTAFKKGLDKLLSGDDSAILNRRIELNGLHRNGKIIPLEVNLTIISQSNGSIFCGFVRDLTDVKKAEALINEKNKYNEQIIESSPEGIIGVNESGDILIFNHQAEKIFGFTKKETIGSNLDLLLPEDESEGYENTNIWKVIKSSLSGKSSALGKTAGRRKNGEWFPADVNVNTISNSGKIISIVSIRDVSEKKRLEKELIREKKFTEDVLNSLPADLAVFSPDHKYLFVNPMAITNKEIREWIIGKDDFDYCKMRGIETTFAEKRRSLFKTVVNEKRTIEFIDPQVTAVGKPKHIFRKFYPVVKNNEVIYVLGYGVDVTTIIEAENQLKSQKAFYENMLDKMPIDVGVIDSELKFVYLNKKAVKRDDLRAWLIGKSEEDFVKGSGKGSELSANRIRMMRDSLDSDDVRSWKETYNEGQPNELHILRTISPYIGPEGKKFLLATGSDVSDIAKAEKELTKKNEALSKTNLELDRFVYSTSHDLRAPLTSLLGLITIVDMNLKPEETKQKDRLRMMTGAVKKLDDFIGEILDYSRNARSEVTVEEINFNKLMNEIRDNLRYMEGTEGYNFEVNIDPSLQLVSDNRRIKVILSNLVSNAIKYQDKNKDLRYSKVSILNDNGNAQIVIEDNGIGISEKDTERIFEMFYRATSLSKGSGLGLYIVKETIDKLNGKINISSELNKGSVFKVHIPNFAS